MAHPEFNPAGGKPGPIPSAEASNWSELNASPVTRSVAGLGPIIGHPVSFVREAGGLRTRFEQSIPLNDRQESSPESCPSEVFLG